MKKVVTGFLVFLLIVVLYLGLCTAQIHQAGAWQALANEANVGQPPKSYTAFQQWGLSFVVVLMLFSKLRLWLPFVMNPHLGA